MHPETPIFLVYCAFEKIDWRLRYFTSVDVADLRGNPEVEFLNLLTAATVKAVHLFPLHPSRAPHPLEPTKLTIEIREARTP